MVGRKRLLAGSLLPFALAPVGALAADIKTQSSTRSLWYNDPFQHDSLDDMDDGVPNGIVVFRGKAAFFR
jgi:hypothetical protein